MKKFNFACVFAAFLVMSSCARAVCTMTPKGGVASSNPLVYNLPSFSTGEFNPNVPNGTILHSQRISLSTGGGAIKCTGGIYPLLYRGVTVVASPNIYSSSVPGVGMRFRYFNAGQWWGYWPQTDTLPFPVYEVPYINETADLQIDFVKTGPITAAGSITGEVAGWFAEGGKAQAQVVSIRVNGSIGVTPKVPTCRVTTPAITVPLGSMPASTFTGVGAVSPSKPFNIVLQCSGGETGTVANVYTTLTDHADPGNVSDTLSLASDATATGIGIQVLNGSTVIKYGPDSSAAGNTNQWKAGTTGNGTFTIPLTARYIQTAPKVTGGTADGLATFTMSYQ